MEGKSSFVLDFSNPFPLRETTGNEEDQESDGKLISNHFGYLIDGSNPT